MKYRIVHFSLLLVLSLALLGGCSSAPPPVNKTPAEVDGKTFLIQAAQAGDQKRVESQLRAGAPINAMAPEGTALYMAAVNGHDEVLWYLLRHGADPDLGTPEGKSPLMVAAENGRTRIVQMLLRAGADINYASEEGMTALASAALADQLAMSKQLINAGADLNPVINGQSLLMRVVARESLLLTGLLVEAGADITYADEEGTTALDLALSHESQSISMLLQQAGMRLKQK